MRIWDLPPKHLCNRHLLGEHWELHAIWSIIINKKKGYRNHPEVSRWRGKIRALYLRHELLVGEMAKRNFKHFSLLDRKLAKGKSRQNVLIDSFKEQKAILRNKKCCCR